MKSAVAARFRCRCPLTHLEQLTPMFLTLIFQYLNKLVESKVGDFSSPQAFHSVKVQGFNRNRIKLLTKVACQLPVKVFALVADFPIQTCELSHTPPPTVRTSNLSGKAFVERPKFVQGAFQRLGVLFLFTRAECQVRVFHAEICPDTLTRRWQRFRFYKIREYIKPIVTASVAFYRDTTDIPIEIAVFTERISDFVMSPFTLIPFSEIESEAILFQRPTRLFQCEGFKLRFPFFDFRSTPKPLEKSLICQVNPFEFFLDRLTWQCLPMWVRRAFQLGYMCAHCLITGIRQSVLIPVTLPLMEILVNLPHIVKQVTKTDRIRWIAKLILIRFHGLSRITHLTPNEWVGSHVTKW